LHSSRLKFSIKDCDVSLLLHDGFDWHHTRKSIEDEIKAVRRRLEKIRQLLASGQTPDESIEQAGTKLFNSIYIGIPSYRATGLEATDYLAALGDDDLLDLGGPDDTSQTTSFQSVKGRADRTSPLPTSSSKTRSSRRRKLARSRNARIEINLVSVRVELKQFAPGAELASKLRLSCRDVEILDHIKTSTWKKFLTQMRSDSRGNVREAGSDMVSIELRNVRPIPDKEAEEGRLRVSLSLSLASCLYAKSMPTGFRLSLGQDPSSPVARGPRRSRLSQAVLQLQRSPALRLAYSASQQGSLPPCVSTPLDPTLAEEQRLNVRFSSLAEHVEIFPIELKLDYKPKRVDYRALREGKTIELMNFFHFDGAEMTLRRVTLSGVCPSFPPGYCFLTTRNLSADTRPHLLPFKVTGWPRLFDMLNDLWTPDVKANQLAEIISGVSPIRSLVNVGSGVADLILLPIEQYKKDGRIVRGVQRGTTSFVKSTALEAIKLGARLATGTQVILEKAEGVLGGRAIGGEMVVEAGGEGSSSSAKGEEAVGGDLTGGGEFSGETRGRGVGWNDPLGTSVTSNSSSSDDDHPDEISRYAHQPADVREGISNAYDSLARNINSAAETILAVPMEVYERSGNNVSRACSLPLPQGSVRFGSVHLIRRLRHALRSLFTSCQGPVRAVVRAIPIAVLKPMIGASEAVSKTLFGLRNTLDPGSRQELEDKYK
jgi:autophagy-related protein 2